MAVRVFVRAEFERRRGEFDRRFNISLDLGMVGVNQGDPRRQRAKTRLIRHDHAVALVLEAFLGGLQPGLAGRLLADVR